MQFTLSIGVGPLPLRFGMTKDTVNTLFSTFDVPSAYAGRDVSPQNAIGAYPGYDSEGRLWYVELSQRCSLLFDKDLVEVFDDESDDLLSHFASLFGQSIPIGSGQLYLKANAFASVSAGKVSSLLVFNDAYRTSRFHT
ncbi:MAG: hypothetical protein ACRC7O_15090 [Fimbriiglobus sp.]